KARRWIRGCHAQHQCGPPNPGFLPTRLISIRRDDAPTATCKLVETGRIDPAEEACYSPPYAALSYCWGQWPNLRTLTKNIAAHRDEIPLQEAPAAVRDAVTLVRDLGYRYIWIDALCIIQDDDLVRAAELSTLGLVYKIANLFLRAGPPDPAGQATTTQTTRVYLRRSPYEAHLALPQDKLSPHNSRTWTLQEGLMARRCLIMTPLEMMWKCLGEHRCECVHDLSLILGPTGARAQSLLVDTMRSMVFPPPDDKTLSRRRLNLSRLGGCIGCGNSWSPPTAPAT
ncbi:heterokaryon incompatibility protein-domain-containing protein, partial [Lasiosphaeria ovina]